MIKYRINVYLLKGRLIAMKAKEYLEQIALGDAIIDNLLHDQEIIRDTMCHMNTDTTKERVQHSKEDRISALYVRLENKEQEVTNKIDELVNLKLKVSGEINQLRNKKHIAVLYNRYILMKSWKEIASALDCTTRYAQRINGNALVAFDKIHSKMLKNMGNEHKKT